MADVIIKKWNGTGWEEHYPKTTVGNIVATGTPSSTTFLRGDGTWSFVPIVTKADLTWTYVYGKAQSAITKGQAVQFAGVQGDHILLKPAVPSEINANPDYFVGVADATVATNDFLYVVDKGEIRDVATNAYSPGTILWFDSVGSTPGALRTTEPGNGYAKIQVGAVTKSNATEGIILVRVGFFGVDIEDIKATGTPSSTTFLRGDGTWATPASASGDFLPLTGGTLTNRLDITTPSSGIAANLIGRASSNLSYITFSNNANSSFIAAIGGRDEGLTFDTAGTERLRINSSGNVGIGTASPAQRLEIYGNTGQPATSGTTQGGLLRLRSGTGSNGYGETLDLGFHVGVSGPASYGWLQSTNADGLNNYYPLALNPNGGNVGIGTTSPIRKLQVAADGTEQFIITGSTDSNKQLILQYNTGTDVASIAAVHQNVAYRTLALNPNGGNVGIGTTSPGAKLHVSGTTLATDLRPTGSTNNGRIYADDWGVKVGTDSGYIWLGPANTGHAHIYTDRPNFYFNKELLVNGNAVFHGGNSSFVQARVRTNWNDNTVINNVVGQLSWNNYGNSHTIFDASSTVSPSGTTVDRVNSQIAWASSYPTLMGWNGSETYGVRVDSSRNSDTVGGYGAGSLWRADGGNWNPGANINLNQTANNQEWSFDITRNGYTGGYWHVWDSSHGSILVVNPTNNAVGINITSPTSKLDIQGGIRTRGSEYNTFDTWTNLPNHTGFYSSNHNSAHFLPNNGTYGAWKIQGARNGWGGIEFENSLGNVSLMIGGGSTATGFHANWYGWQFLWETGSFFVSKASYGGSLARVWDNANLTFSLSGSTLTINAS